MTISLHELEWRGLINDCTDRAGVEKLTPSDAFYIGYDPTAESLQIGNLAGILTSVRLAQAGLKPLQLFGGATGAIGDPGGRTTERQMLSRETIDRNVQNHQKLVRRIFERLGVNNVEFVNNYDWTNSISVLDFLRDVGKHFTVNYLLQKEHIKTRVEGDGISYTEFSYLLLQSYDFKYLYEHKSCKLQIGGSDQWGNITGGLEYIRRTLQGEAFALSFPLITDSQGKKFGKSAEGAVWLDERFTSPYKFYQFWLNVPDSEVSKLLKVYTFKSEEEIKNLEEEMKQAPERRIGQKALAEAVTEIVHGPENLARALKATQVFFGGGTEGISSEDLDEIFKDSPSSEITDSEYTSLSLLDLFVKSGLVKSKGEARRLHAGGGMYLNNNKVENPDLVISELDDGKSGRLVLRSGKKSYHVIRITR